MRLIHFVATHAVAALTACASDAVGPESGSLRLEATIGRSVLQTGDTTSLVFRLRNVGDTTVVLGFGTSCQVLPYITTSHKAAVYPSSGNWGCLAVVTRLSLDPGAEKVITVLVRGGADVGTPGSYFGSIPNAVPLLPGAYLAFARLEHPDVTLRSVSVSFRVN